MVKTPFGRKPGPKHARIVKKLRHRRRMMARQLVEAQKTEIVDTFSCEVTTVAPELEHVRLYFTPSKTTDTLSFDEVVNADEVGERQVIPYKANGKVVSRGVSEAIVGSGNGHVVDRSTLSESNIHQAGLAMPSSAAPIENEAGRPQHPDEDTDQYLAHLFTPSLANITDEPTQDTRSDEFARLRNLFSSDTQHTNLGGTSSEFTSSLLTNTTSLCLTCEGPRNPLFRGEKTPGNHSREQATFKPGLPTSLSDASLGLNTLFNNKTTLKDSTSCETSMGLRTLFEEKGRQIKSSASTFGLNTLFNTNGKDDEEAICVSPSQRSHGCNCKSVGEQPSVTASSSLLGNLFDVQDADEELLTAKERKKALIAKDLAQYLNSDDERTHPKSTSMSTFVQQIESIFGKYRAALLETEKLQAELNALKKAQQ